MNFLTVGFPRQKVSMSFPVILDLVKIVSLQLRLYFKSSLEPILTPLAVDPGHPFPYIGNLTSSIAVVSTHTSTSVYRKSLVRYGFGVQYGTPPFTIKDINMSKI